MVKKKNYFFEGLPIKSKLKVAIVGILLFALFLNTVIPAFFDFLDYPFNGIVSIIIVLTIVVSSIGSMTAESIVLGILVLAFFSNWWDVGGVLDRSNLRNHILVWTIALVGITSFLGKVSLTNLFLTIKNQLGVGK